MSDEITIPALPCRSIEQTLEFYVALGFEITYQQSRPNNYAAVRRGGINLHFFTMKDYDPANSYSTCIVLVPDADALYHEFGAGLKRHYGKRPLTGIPRITALANRSGGRGFNLIDPGGNWIRITQHQTAATEAQEPASRPDRALEAADLLANSKGDHATAAKLLDNLLSGAEPLTRVQEIKARVARADLAVTSGDEALARKVLSELNLFGLSDEEEQILAADLERAVDLQETLD